MRVGVIGRGFGERVVAAAFNATDGCEVVDVVTPRDEASVVALCARPDIDLIAVHSPPFMHRQHVQQAIEGGKAVLCDKPFGRNLEDATAMSSLAEAAGVQGFVNFENRYGTRGRAHQLVIEGAVGQPEHMQFTMMMSATRVPVRPYGWLFDAELGGGWLRGLGAHIIDFTRWTFGEVVEAAGQLRTVISERPSADGDVHKCTADDGFVATLRTDRGVTSMIDSTATAAVDIPSTMLIVGSAAVLELSAESRITIHTASGSEEVFAAQPGQAGLVQAQRTWAKIIRDAVHDKATPPDAPTFTDGVACAEVMERVASSTGRH